MTPFLSDIIYYITQKNLENGSFRNRENLPKMKTANTISLILHEHAHLILCVNWSDELTGSEDIDQQSIGRLYHV